MKNPLILITIFYIIGILLEDILNIHSFYIIILLILSIPTYILLKEGFIFKRCHTISIIFINLLFILIGMFSLDTSLSRYKSSPHYIGNIVKSGDYVTILGSISAPIDITELGERIYIKIDKIYLNDNSLQKAYGNILINLKDGKSGLFYGDYVKVSLKLTYPLPLGTPGTMDYARYLRHNNIDFTSSLYNKEKIVKIGKGEGSIVITLAEKFRVKVRDFVIKSINSPEREVFLALILGYGRLIPKEITEQFSSTGTTHLLSISGLHVSILALTMFLFFKKVLSISESLIFYLDVKRISLIFSIIPVILYVIISGSQVPTERSAIMVISCALSLILKRETSLLNNLTLAAFIILIFSPLALFQISFQLSFLSIMALDILVPPFSSCLKIDKILKDEDKKKRFSLNNCLYYIANTIIASFAATIGTLPIVVYYFHKVSWTGVFINLIAIPLSSPIIPISFLGVILIFISPSLAFIILKIASFLITILLKFIALSSKIPYGSFYPVSFSLIEVILLYFIMMSIPLIKVRKFRFNWPLWLSIIILVIYLGGGKIYEKLDNKLRITFIDVGQGDSIMIRFPNGEYMLIDGGGDPKDRYDPGERTIAPYLWFKKIKKIDYLVLTHPHPDHFGGLAFIANNFKIKEFWSSKEFLNFDNYPKLKSAINNNKIKEIEISSARSSFIIEGVEVKILWPPSDFIEKTSSNMNSSVNNRSLVIKLTYGKYSFLFPADIEKETENQLVKECNNLKSYLIKAPHHGSINSSMENFLDCVSPKYVVFTVGYQNSYGFPRDEVLRRYKKRGVKIYRTDYNGSIEIKTDGKNIDTTIFRSI